MPLRQQIATQTFAQLSQDAEIDAHTSRAGAAVLVGPLLAAVVVVAVHTSAAALSCGCYAAPTAVAGEMQGLMLIEMA